jgi:hypothetical protein
VLLLAVNHVASACTVPYNCRVRILQASMRALRVECDAALAAARKEVQVAQAAAAASESARASDEMTFRGEVERMEVGL